MFNVVDYRVGIGVLRSNNTTMDSWLPTFSICTYTAFRVYLGPIEYRYHLNSHYLIS